MQKIPTILLLCIYSMFSEAACEVVVDFATELPPQTTTTRGVVISFEYDFLRDQYYLSWQKGNRQSELFGPFPFTMACATASVRWESDDYLLLERGCGTFCWYVKIFHLFDSGPFDIPDYERVERPLSFDDERNLLAYYYAQDLIRVRNLNTGYEQEITTKYACEFASGLCISNVTFNGSTLNYNWRGSQTGEQISTLLSRELLQND